MGTIVHDISEDFSVVTVYDGKLTTVKIVDYAAGVKATGHAKLAPEDTEFDLKVGQTLAYVRAYQRYLRKVEKKIAHDPEIGRLVTGVY